MSQLGILSIKTEQAIDVNSGMADAAQNSANSESHFKQVMAGYSKEQKNQKVETKTAQSVANGKLVPQEASTVEPAAQNQTEAKHASATDVKNDNNQSSHNKRSHHTCADKTEKDADVKFKTLPVPILPITDQESAAQESSDQESSVQESSVQESADQESSDQKNTDFTNDLSLFSLEEKLASNTGEIAPLAVSKDQDILPVPPSLESSFKIKGDDLSGSVKAKSKDEHILPVPPSLESNFKIISDDLSFLAKAKLKDEHILPVPPSLEITSDDLSSLAKAKLKDEHILPVPPSVNAVAVKQQVDSVANVSNISTINGDTDHLLQSLVDADLLLSQAKPSKGLAEADLQKVSTSTVTSTSTLSSTTQNSAQQAAVINANGANITPDSIAQQQAIADAEALSQSQQDKSAHTDIKVDLSKADVSKADVTDTTASPKIASTVNIVQGVVDERLDNTQAQQNVLTQAATKVTEAQVVAQVNSSRIDQENQAKNAALEKVIIENQHELSLGDGKQTANSEDKSGQSEKNSNLNKTNNLDKSANIAEVDDKKTASKLAMDQSVDKNTQTTKAATAAITNPAMDNSLSSADRREQIEQYFIDHDLAVDQLGQSVDKSQTTTKALNTLTTQTLPIYHKDFVNKLQEKVMVMVHQKIQQVEIQLDPPELGNVHVRVNLQNEQAAVQFVVQNQQAKEALEQNIDKLKNMMADSGVNVGDTNIEQGDRENDQQSLEQQQQFAANNGNDAELQEQAEPQQWQRQQVTSSGIDYFA